MCKKFGSGPCGEIFKRWLNCTDKYPGKDSAGEPLHLTKCIDLAEELGSCLDNHADHYSSKDDEEEDNKRHQQTHDHTSKEAWSDFVMEIEHGIKSKKFVTSPFSEKYHPSMQFKRSNTCAAIFAPDMNGAPIVTAYIIDENNNLLAAGSKEDMDMGSFGCVLQFDVPDATKSVTCRVIYDSEKDDGAVIIFTTTTLVPRSYKDGVLNGFNMLAQSPFTSFLLYKNDEPPSHLSVTTATAAAAATTTSTATV
ncbi:hypothetical protein ACHAWC_002039 [Mediolabrus comicus]